MKKMFIFLMAMVMMPIDCAAAAVAGPVDDLRKEFINLLGKVADLGGGLAALRDGTALQPEPKTAVIDTSPLAKVAPTGSVAPASTSNVAAKPFQPTVTVTTSMSSSATKPADPSIPSTFGVAAPMPVAPLFSMTGTGTQPGVPLQTGYADADSLGLFPHGYRRAADDDDDDPLFSGPISFWMPNANPALQPSTQPAIANMAVNPWNASSMSGVAAQPFSTWSQPFPAAQQDDEDKEPALKPVPVPVEPGKAAVFHAPQAAMATAITSAAPDEVVQKITEVVQEQVVAEQKKAEAATQLIADTEVEEKDLDAQIQELKQQLVAAQHPENNLNNADRIAYEQIVTAAKKALLIGEVKTLNEAVKNKKTVGPKNAIPEAAKNIKSSIEQALRGLRNSDARSLVIKRLAQLSTEATNEGIPESFLGVADRAIADSKKALTDLFVVKKIGKEPKSKDVLQLEKESEIFLEALKGAPVADTKEIEARLAVLKAQKAEIEAAQKKAEDVKRAAEARAIELELGLLESQLTNLENQEKAAERELAEFNVPDNMYEVAVLKERVDELLKLAESVGLEIYNRDTIKATIEQAQAELAAITGNKNLTELRDLRAAAEERMTGLKEKYERDGFREMGNETQASFSDEEYEEAKKIIIENPYGGICNKHWNALRKIVDCISFFINNKKVTSESVLELLLPQLEYRSQSLLTSYLLLTNNYQEPTFLAWVAGALVWYSGQDMEGWGKVFFPMGKYCTYQCFKQFDTIPDGLLDPVKKECRRYVSEIKNEDVVTLKNVRAPAVKGAKSVYPYVDAIKRNFGTIVNPNGFTLEGLQICNDLLSFIAAKELLVAVDKRIDLLDKEKQAIRTRIQKIQALTLPISAKINALKLKQFEHDQQARESYERDLAVKEAARVKAEQEKEEKRIEAIRKEAEKDGIKITGGMAGIIKIFVAIANLVVKENIWCTNKLDLKAYVKALLSEKSDKNMYEDGPKAFGGDDYRYLMALMGVICNNSLQSAATLETLASNNEELKAFGDFIEFFFGNNNDGNLYANLTEEHYVKERVANQPKANLPEQDVANLKETYTKQYNDLGVKEYDWKKNGLAWDKTQNIGTVIKLGELAGALSAYFLIRGQRQGNGLKDALDRISPVLNNPPQLGAQRPVINLTRDVLVRNLTRRDYKGSSWYSKEIAEKIEGLLTLSEAEKKNIKEAKEKVAEEAKKK